MLHRKRHKLCKLHKFLHCSVHSGVIFCVNISVNFCVLTAFCTYTIRKEYYSSLKIMHVLKKFYRENATNCVHYTNFYTLVYTLVYFFVCVFV